MLNKYILYIVVIQLTIISGLNTMLTKQTIDIETTNLYTHCKTMYIFILIRQTLMLIISSFTIRLL